MADDNYKRQKALLKFIIKRYDTYYNSINFKARFFTALATFIISAFVYKVSYFTTTIEAQCLLYLQYGLIIITLALCFFTIYKLISSVMPYLDSDKNKESLIFFNDVSGFKSLNEYKEAFEGDDYNIHQDLVNQAYSLAKGLDRKFTKLKHATYALYLTGGAIILILTIKLFSLS